MIISIPPAICGRSGKRLTPIFIVASLRRPICKGRTAETVSKLFYCRGQRLDERRKGRLFASIRLSFRSRIEIPLQSG